MSIEKAFRSYYKKNVNPTLKATDFCDRLGISRVHPQKSKLRRYHNPYKTTALVAAGVAGAIFVVAPAAVILAMSIKVESHPHASIITYSLREKAIMEQDTFRALNKVDYPEQEFSKQEVGEDYRKAVNAFAYSLTSGVDLSSGCVYSPLTAYVAMDLFSFAADTPTREIYSSALGSGAMRNRDYSSMLRTNFYLDDNGTTQLYNAIFFNSDQGYAPKQSYVDFLSSRKAEAFTSSFHNDLDQIAAWANEKAGENWVSPASFPKFSDDSVLLDVSYLYFKGRWATSFLKETTHKRTFHGKKGDTSVDFMRHVRSSYWVESIDKIEPGLGAYEYEDYFSVYDQYRNLYTVQYLVPKEDDADIFKILEGVNYFEEDPEAYYFMPHEGENKHNRAGTVIEYLVPKFEMSSSVDLTEAFQKTSLSPLFGHGIVGGGAFAEAFDYGENQIDYSGIEWAKQINRIQFNEDGTIAKSIHFQNGFAAGAAAPSATGISLDLNQPFVYVIRDPNGLPMFVGSVTDLGE